MHNLDGQDAHPTRVVFKYFVQNQVFSAYMLGLIIWAF
ncbi:hypothetical protein NSP_28430 [Nodularia spumigena CCY9414]|nr:hypothetical protein NSP_28430 [Nodularia spumigena CCY9414]